MPAYLMENHGIPISFKTLERFATAGSGPLITYYGRTPLYATSDLDAWAAMKLGTPVRSTSEKVAELSR